MPTPRAKDLSSDNPTSSPRRAFWFAAFIAIITFAVYFPVLRHWFVYWDDDFFIMRNVDINTPTLSSLAKFWAHPLEGDCQFQVPMNYTMWWLLAHIARVPTLEPGHAVLIGPAFHALNLTFHLIACVATFLILLKLTGRDVPAAIGALLFAIHPLQSEPVSWAANMYTSLSGCLALLAMLTYLSFADNASRTRWIRYTLGTLLYTLALLSKPSVSFLPIAIVLIEVTLRGRRIRDCKPLALWLAIGFVDGLLTHHIQTGIQAYVPPIWQRFFIAGDALTFYLAKTLLPFRLIPDYGRSPQMVLQTSFIWIAWIVPTLIGLLCFARRRSTPWLFCGFGLFVLGVLPMLGFLPFDFQAFSTVADRYLYLSLFGVALIAAYAAVAVMELDFARQTRLAITAGTLALLAFSGFLARQQTDTWQDTGTLFHHTLAINPKSQVAHLQLGYVLLNRGGHAELEEALNHYLAVLDDRPTDAHLLGNIGLVLRRLNRPTEAAAFFNEAWKLAPNEPNLEGALAQAQQAAGDNASAAIHFKSLNARFPNGRGAQAAIDPR
jgi:hypothetical protein